MLVLFLQLFPISLTFSPNTLREKRGSRVDKPRRSAGTERVCVGLETPVSGAECKAMDFDLRTSKTKFINPGVVAGLEVKKITCKPEALDSGNTVAPSRRDNSKRRMLPLSSHHSTAAPGGALRDRRVGTGSLPSSRQLPLPPRQCPQGGSGWESTGRWPRRADVPGNARISASSRPQPSAKSLHLRYLVFFD